MKKTNVFDIGNLCRLKYIVVNKYKFEEEKGFKYLGIVFTADDNMSK